MILKSKICGVSDTKTLNYITNHIHPPQFIGFIVNYPKSKRYVHLDKVKKLLEIDKKKSFYVAVLVNPDYDILEKIKDLPFDYYQLYNCNPLQVKTIKDKYKKIITAITVDNKEDIDKYQLYLDSTDIYLFDSKGYEKSMSFDHKLIKDLNINREIMLAGNIQIDDDLENYKKIADIIDISGGLETSGIKDKSKIDIFLKKVEQVQNET